jgi:hypothetical protein
MQAQREFQKEIIHRVDSKEVRAIITPEEYKALSEYLAYQKAKLTDYTDYIKACTTLGLQFTDAENRYPKNFWKMHDRRIAEMRDMEERQRAEKEKELFAQFAIVSEKYSKLAYLKNGIAIVIPASPSDLVREGNALHHCVGRMGYDKKMATEESIICFVRNIASPDVPLATIELSLNMKNILQCRAEHNSKPPEQILEAVYKKWLPYAKRQLKKIQATA